MSISPDPSPARRVVIFALNGLEMDRRVENEARALSDAGFDVVRVGLREYVDQPLEEATGFDTVIRLAPEWHRPKPERGSAPDHTRSAAPLRRQWSAKVRLMFAVRRAFPRTLRSIDRLRSLRRWDYLLAEMATHLRPAVVVACDFNTLSAGVAVKRTTGCGLVYDAHEMWTEQYSNRFLIAPIKRHLRATEGRLMRQADLCTTVSRRFAAAMAERYRIPAPLVVYSGTEHCAGSVSPPHTPVRLYFQGSFSRDRGLEDIIRAMNGLRGRAVLTLQGFGPLEAELRELVERESLSSIVTFEAPCAPSDVVEACGGHDIGIVAGRVDSMNARLTTPNRPFVYFGGGLAVVTPAELEEIAEIVTESGSGVVFRADGPGSVREAILRLVEDPAALAESKQRSLELCAQFQWGVQFGRVVEQIDTLTGSLAPGSR